MQRPGGAKKQFQFEDNLFKIRCVITKIFYKQLLLRLISFYKQLLLRPIKKSFRMFLPDARNEHPLQRCEWPLRQIADNRGVH